MASIRRARRRLPTARHSRRRPQLIVARLASRPAVLASRRRCRPAACLNRAQSLEAGSCLLRWAEREQEVLARARSSSPRADPANHGAVRTTIGRSNRLDHVRRYRLWTKNAGRGGTGSLGNRRVDAIDLRICVCGLADLNGAGVRGLAHVDRPGRTGRGSACRQHRRRDQDRRKSPHCPFITKRPAWTDGLDGASTRCSFHLRGESSGQGIQAAGVPQSSLDVYPGHPLTPIVAEVGVVQRARRFVCRIGDRGDRLVIGAPSGEWRKKGRDIDRA